MTEKLQNDLNSFLKQHDISLPNGTKIVAGYIPVVLHDSHKVTMLSNGMNGNTTVTDRSGLFILRSGQS